MTKQTIIRKLSSRKFWACVSGFAVSVMAMFRYPDSTVTLVTSLITSAGCLVAYILAEGYSDGNGSSGSTPDNSVISDNTICNTDNFKA